MTDKKPNWFRRTLIGVVSAAALAGSNVAPPFAAPLIEKARVGIIKVLSGAETPPIVAPPVLPRPAEVVVTTDTLGSLCENLRYQLEKSCPVTPRN